MGSRSITPLPSSTWFPFARSTRTKRASYCSLSSTKTAAGSASACVARSSTRWKSASAFLLILHRSEHRGFPGGGNRRHRV